MANDKNSNELNRLNKNGNIQKDEIKKEEKKILEEVEEGKKTTDELPQYISEDRILAEIQNNEIYKMMVGICVSEGYPINQKILDFMSNKKVKPSELEDELNDVIQDVITDINGDTHYAVFFTDEGKVDIQESVQKAQQYNLEIPTYIISLAEDAGEKIEDLKTSERMLGLDVSFNRSKEEIDALDKIFEPTMYEYGKKVDEFLGKHADDWEINKDDKGNTFVKTNYSEKANLAINLAANLKKLLVNSADDVGERQANLLDILRVYEFLKNTDWINEISEDKRADFLNMIEEAKRTIEDKCNLYYSKDITKEEDIDDILKFFRKTRDDLGSIEDSKIYGEIQENLKSQNFEDIDIDAYALREKDEVITMIRAFSYSLTSMSDFNVHNAELTNKAVSYNRAVFNRLEQAFPEYFKEAMAGGKSDEYAVLRLTTLREIKAKELFNKRFNDTNHEPHEGSDINLNDFQAIKIAAGILKSRGYSKEIREMAMETIVRFLPEVSIDKAEQQKFINLESFRNTKELDAFIDKVQKESMFRATSGRNPSNILTGEEFAFAGMQSLDMMARSSITAEIIHKGNGEKGEFSVLNSEEYKKLFAEKIKEANDRMYDIKYIETITRDISSTIRDIESGKILTKEREIAFVKKLVIAAKELKDRNMPEIELMVKEYLIDYLPDAFEKRGNFDIDYESLDGKYSDYIEIQRLEQHEIAEIEDGVKQELAEKTREAISKTKLSTDIVRSAEDNSMRLAAGLSKEKELEHLEDEIRFVNYILRRKEYLSPEKQEELEGYAETVISDRRNVHKHVSKSLEHIGFDPLESHEDFDEYKYKKKFDYLEKEARKVVATERINEAVNRFQNNGANSITEKEEIQGILGTYMGILNDYKNEELDVSGYKILMGKLTSLIKKVDASLIDEDGIIDEDKVLEKYNEVNETDFERVEDVSEYEETELLMRYARRLSAEVKEHALKKDRKYLSVIENENTYIKHKIQETVRTEVAMNARMSTELIAEVWRSFSRDDENLSEPDLNELISCLALVEGAFGSKSLRRKGLSYEESLIQELESKTLTVARHKMAEIFPEAFDKDDGTFDRTKLTMLVQDYFEKNDPDIRDRLDNGETIFEALRNQREVRSNKFVGPSIGFKSTEELLSEVKEFLKGEEKEKTYEDNVLVGRMIVGMADRYNKTSLKTKLLDKLSEKMSEEEKEKYFEDVFKGDLDEKTKNAMRRIGGIRSVEEFQAKYKLKGKEKIENVLNPAARAKYLLLATGALLACREMPNDGVNQEITDMLIDQISKLSPKSVNSKGIVDFERIKNDINQYKQSLSERNIKVKQYQSVEDLFVAATKKIDMKSALDLYEEKIDARYTNKYYVPRSNDRVISKTEMDRMMEERGEEIFVDQTPEITAEPPKSLEETEIRGDELTTFFDENAVEVGGAEQVVEEVSASGQEMQTTVKVEQQVEENNTGMSVENIEGPEDGWQQNLPAKQGFIKTIFNNVRKVITDKWNEFKKNIANRNSNSNANSSGNSSASSSGGVNKAEQNIENLTGYGKIELKRVDPTVASISEEKKSKEGRTEGEQNHDEEVL